MFELVNLKGERGQREPELMVGHAHYSQVSDTFFKYIQGHMALKEIHINIKHLKSISHVIGHQFDILNFFNIQTMKTVFLTHDVLWRLLFIKSGTSV